MAAKIFSKLADALAAPSKVRRLSLFVKHATKLPDFGVFSALEELELFDQGPYLTKFPDVTSCTTLRALTFRNARVSR